MHKDGIQRNQSASMWMHMWIGYSFKKQSDTSGFSLGPNSTNACETWFTVSETQDSHGNHTPTKGFSDEHNY